MSDCQFGEASLFYRAPTAPLDQVDTVALRALLDGMGLGVTCIRRHACGVIALEAAQVQVLIVGCDLAFPVDHFRGVMRPDDDDQDTQRAVLSMLAAHRSSLTILASRRGTADSVDPEVVQSTVWEALDHLMATTRPDLVFWAEDDRLLTPSEAESDIMAQEARFRDTSAGPHAASLDWTKFPLEDTDKNPDGAYSPRSDRARAWFAGGRDFIPLDEDALVDAMRGFLDLHPEREVSNLNETAIGRSSLFVMSATIGVFALPMGAAALTYNALSGGDFRFTSHMMALSGVTSVLTGLGTSLPAFAF